MGPKSTNFIRWNGQNFYLSSQDFEIRWLIGDGSLQQMQNFSTISEKLCQLGPKNTGALNVNTTIDVYLVIYETVLTI